MYVWIWRHLPGGGFSKSVGCLVLFAGVVALLFFVVFPRAGHWLPFNNVTIDRGSTHSTGVTPSPSP